ncbi:MAG: di-heme oxidoredictase family protein [Betaproteobacteria bacterium]
MIAGPLRFSAWHCGRLSRAALDGLLRSGDTQKGRLRTCLAGVAVLGATVAFAWEAPGRVIIGEERALPVHIEDEVEHSLSAQQFIAHGKRVFGAIFTEEDGAGRPLSKGTGRQLTDPSRPLSGLRMFNRISGPDANSCAGCHNMPYGISGGGGDFVTNVFVQGHRFDFVTFDAADTVPTRGSLDEAGAPVSLQTVGNFRATTGLFGAGFIEMLARQMTADLQRIRDSVALGQTAELWTKGIFFGRLTRRADATWDTTGVEGLPRQSVIAPTPLDKPSLIIRPWHQAGSVVSLREFSNNAFNHHHGMQPAERFGRDTDLDGDGFTNELTRGDITAVSLYQATIAVPGRVIPRVPEVERAVLNGEHQFAMIGCSRCHVPALPLERKGWVYSEPNPYNPLTNHRAGEGPTVSVDLTSDDLPPPRLKPLPGELNTLFVPLFSDLKLHDITDPADPAEAEAIDMNWFVWSPKFLDGNRRFLTKRLWGAANEPPFFHHGLFTTLRQSILAHHGEALTERLAFQRLSEYDRSCIIEFLKSLQVLPPGITALVVDEQFRPREWPPAEAW